MTAESLAKSRLVCRQWRNLASRHLQKELMKTDRSIRLTAGKWVDFARTFDTEQKSLFVWKKLTLDAVPLEQMFPTNMFANYGCGITHLSLNIGSRECITLSSFQALMYSLPNLTSLCLGMLTDSISALKGECSQKLILFVETRSLICL